MAEPTGERLAALESAVAGLKQRVGERFDDLKGTVTDQFRSLDKLLWRAIVGGIAATVTLWGGFAVLYKEIHGVDQRLVAIESQLKGVSSAVESIPGEVAELKTISSLMSSSAETFKKATGDVRSAAGALAEEIKSMPKIPLIGGEAPGTLNILVFDERQESFIKTVPKKLGVVGTTLVDKVILGDFVKNPELLNLLQQWPDFAVKEAPQLASTRFAVGDAHIVIARSADNRVVAVVML